MSLLNKHVIEMAVNIYTTITMRELDLASTSKEVKAIKKRYIKNMDAINRWIIKGGMEQFPDLSS